MLSSFLIALREGVEAALVVGIVLVYLNRTGRAVLVRWVWGGVVAAVLSSLAVAIALERWKVSEDGFEGVLLLVAAVFVVTMIIWMNRVARHLKKEIEQRVEVYAGKSDFSAGMGLATFVFLMVVREGAELALILRAVQLSSEGLGVWIGTSLGLGVAIAVGWFFFQGTLKISLSKFFSATSTILILVAVQLALTQSFDLILMDIQMPILDGYAASAKIRSADQIVPIIVLTAHATPQDRAKSMAAGCSE